MNLGNMGAFAGGAVKGYNAQEQLSLQQQEAAANQGFRERQLKMQEADQAEQQSKRDRDKAMRDESAALFNETFADKTEQVGESEGEDGLGGTVKIPIMKTTKADMGDAALQKKWYEAHLRITAKHSGMTPQMMSEVSKYVEDARRTEHGKLLDKVTSGDKAALVTLLKNAGVENPEGAEYQFKPLENVNQIKMADGKVIDLKKWAQANATVGQQKEMMAAQEQAMKAADHAATRSNLGATQKLHETQAGEITAQAPLKSAEIQARTAQHGAAAGASSASAELSRAKTKNVGADTNDKNDVKATKALVDTVKGAIGVDPQGDGKAKNTEQYAYVLGRSAQLMKEGKHKQPPGAVAEARARWSDVEQQATDWVKKMSKDDLKKKFPGKNADQVKAEAIRRALAQDATLSVAEPTARRPAPAEAEE